jgi:hypothetical protein
MTMRVIRPFLTAVQDLDRRDPLLLASAILSGVLIGSVVAYGVFLLFVW